jgi:hypothetical protein
LDVDVAYWETPDAVVWVDTPRRRLQGFDNYWFAGNTYGVYNDPDNADMYDGAMAFAWHLDDDGTEIALPETKPPANATILRGVMLTDDDARAVGIL